MNEEQVIHAMGIDDAYHVERVLAEGPSSITELVTIDGAGPFVRKKIPSELANRGVWATLADCTCPRLPRVAATYEMPDRFVAVYDFIPGDTLEHAVATRGALGADQAARIAQEICEAVADLHTHGIVHGDLTPANIIVAADGVHVIDLGLARIRGQEASQTSKKPLGTWGFASPEQYGFAQVDERSDTYAVARLLGYMLTGVRPSEDAYETALADERLVPAALRGVVERGSAFEPSARYQSAVEVAQATAEVLAGSDAQDERGARGAQAAHAAQRVAMPKAVAAAQPTAAAVAPQVRHASTPTPKKSRRGIVIGIAAVAVVVVAAIGVFLASGGASSSSTAPGQTTPTSSASSATGGSTSTANAKDAADALEIIESGWSVDPGGYIYYGFGIRNNSTSAAIDFPTVGITGRDESGRILFSNDQVISCIEPGQTLYFGSVTGNGTAPTTVEFTAKSPDDYAIVTPSSNSPTFRISNLAEVSNGLGGSSFTGELELVSGAYSKAWASGAAVTVILRDESGAIVYGNTGFTDQPTQGAPIPFEVLGGTVPEHATIEAYAQVW